MSIFKKIMFELVAPAVSVSAACAGELAAQNGVTFAPKLDTSPKHKAGSNLHFRAPPECLHLFDRQSGQRIS